MAAATMSAKAASSLMAGFDAGLEGLEDILRKALLHLIKGEDVLAVDQVDLLIAEVEAALKARLGKQSPRWRCDGLGWCSWIGGLER
jgi:hypothetical protein